MTAEKQKGKYVYYRCSHGRGKCSLPYMREQEVSDRIGDVLNDIYSVGGGYRQNHRVVGF